MPDHEFEKHMQEKMGGLKITPSAPVWDRVEGALDKKEKSRRKLLWIPFFLALLVGSSLVIRNYHGFSSNNISSADKNENTARVKAGTHPNVAASMAARKPLTKEEGISSADHALIP